MRTDPPREPDPATMTAAAPPTMCDVLIVEDHADTAHVVRRVLGRAGLRAEVAASGLEALAFLEAGGRPRCLLLDQMMPAMTGLELLRLLRATPAHRDVPACFYSAAQDWQPRAEADALGARAWFVKGVTPVEDVVAQVRACCAVAAEAEGGEGV